MVNLPICSFTDIKLDIISRKFLPNPGSQRLFSVFCKFYNFEPCRSVNHSELIFAYGTYMDWSSLFCTWIFIVSAAFIEMIILSLFHWTALALLLKISWISYLNQLSKYTCGSSLHFINLFVYLNTNTIWLL